MRTIDNNLGKCIVEDAHELEFLQGISGLTLKQLARNNQLFTIPNEFSSEIQDETPVFNLDRQNALHTGNVVGFIGNGSSTLSISSRFDENRGDWLIHYMLCRALGLNITTMSTFGSYESALDLLPLFFPSYLRRALAQGIYQPYSIIEHNDLKLKGRIDISRHIKGNVPFVGRIASVSRERSADNHVTQLIRHTIEYINRISDFKGIFSFPREIADDIKLIKSITPSFNKRDLRKVVVENLRVQRHPYYTEYAALQKLCLMILNHRKLAYDGQKNKIHGLLIDAAWLWEEYLAVILKSLKIKHPRNRSGSGAIYISNQKVHPHLIRVNYQERYPDIYTNNGVMDAKYKRGVSRDDFHQIITYIHIMGKKYGVLLSPNDFAYNSRDSYNINGGGILHHFKLGIPNTQATFSDFIVSMQKLEQELLDWLFVHETTLM